MPTVRSLRRVVFAVVVAGLTVGTVAPGGAQPVGAPPSADDLRVVEVDATASPDIVAVAAVPASLRDATVDPSAFTVTADGEQVGVAVEPLTADQLTVALVLDTAGDISRNTLVAQQGAAVEFVLQLDPRSPVVIASTTAGAVFGPSTDRRLALQAVQDLERSGPRQTVGSIGSVLDAAGIGTSRRAVVVVSGGPDASGDDGASVGARLAGNSTLQWIAAAPGGEPPVALADLATVTPSSNEDLLPLLDVVAATLVGQYRLRFSADAGSAVQISLGVGDETWTAAVPLPAPPVAPPVTTAVTTAVTSSAPDSAPDSSAASVAPESTAPATTTANASTTAASVGPPAPDETVGTAGDETATSSVEDDSGSFPTLALLSVLLLVAGLGAVLFFMRDRLQPMAVRPGPRPTKRAPPTRATSRPRPARPPQPKRGRKPASTKTAATAPPPKKTALPSPGNRPTSPAPPPPPPAPAPLPAPEPATTFVDPDPVVIQAPGLPITEPLAATPSVSDRLPPRPVPYQLVEPPAAVKVASARDRGEPRIGARPKGGYRPSRSLAKSVSGDVRSAGPYLQP